MGRVILELGAFDAVIAYNNRESARAETFSRLKVEPGDQCVVGFCAPDGSGIAQSRLSAKKSVIKARKAKRYNIADQRDDSCYIRAGF